MADSGRVLSRYRILRPLGKGGMGEVLLAEDSVLGRKLALKFLPDEAAADATARSRFLREAKSAAALDDPFICKVYETGEDEGRPFIAMEYVEGESLRDRLGRGAMPLDEAVRTACEVAEALGIAHEHGIIHRDLKPGNIMLTPQGHAKVLDFGLAKQVIFPGKSGTEDATATSDDLTMRGTPLGTLAYMSPEQLRAEPLGPPSDVFSFGVVLHELLTGRHPFSRPSVAETIKAIMSEPAPPLGIAGPAAAEALTRVVERALAKDPQGRYPSAVEMAADLGSLSGSLARARPRRPALGLAAVAVLVAAVAAGGLWLARRGGPPAPATELSPVSVLVADFDNRTGDPMFDGVLERATSIVLEDASFINPYKRQAALRSAEAIRPGASVLDEELARLVAQRDGVNIVVSGSIERSGKGYQLRTTVLDPVSGEPIGDHRLEAGNREAVLAAVGKLAGRSRESLGDTDREAIRRATEESFTASSLEAARGYVQAQDLLTAGKWQEAIDAFSALVEEHPDMGRAYSGIAVALANMGRREEAAGYYEQAIAHIDQMTEREKGRTRGTYYLMTRNWEKASEVYEQLVASYPFDEAARVNLVLGYFYGRQMDRALAAARDAVDAFPGSAMAQANLALVAMYASDFATAKSQAEKVIAGQPGYETAYVCLALSRLTLGEREAAVADYRRLAGVSEWGASLAAAGLADIALYHGRVDEAAAILEEAAARDLEAGNGAAAARKLTTLAQAELARGRSIQAADTARRAVQVSRQGPVLYEAALALLAAGDRAGALGIAAALAGELAPEQRAYAPLIEGEVALGDGDARRAATLFHDSHAILDTWIGRVALGRAYVASGAFTEAHAELENALLRRGEAASVFCDDLPTLHYLPPVHYWMGRAQEGLGSPAAAVSYRTFLEIKSDAGADPLAEDARRRLAAL